MNKIQYTLKKMVNKYIYQNFLNGSAVFDAAGAKAGGTGRELAITKRFTYKAGTESDFEDPEYDFSDIEAGYNADSYIRQGVDKYVDQIFKEGYRFYGNEESIVEYINLRLAYIAESTGIPTNGFLIEIAEDLVKYGNCMIVKARGNDPNTMPQGMTLQGMFGGDPVVGYFVVDPITMKCKRDEFGTIEEWQQESEAGSTQTFKPEDVVHLYYKRRRGSAYGTSFLVPVLDDVRALRQAEENVLKMMYRNIYPFMHVAVGSKEIPGSKDEIIEIEDAIANMDVEGGLVTSERTTIKAIASDQVIDAAPYLKYMEERVFSGMGIPGIMFGRGNTSNRSTGDNMTSEMADRIRAICKTIEMFINEFIVKELLMEGGYDPVIEPDNAVQFKFDDNDVDVKIKKEVHAIYKYEHNSITEDEMRKELGLDPIPDGDREKMFVELITRETIRFQGQITAANSSGEETGTKETNNKSKNSGGKSSGSNSQTTKKKTSKDSIEVYQGVGIIKDYIDLLRKDVKSYVKFCYDSNLEINQSEIWKRMVDCNRNIIYTIESKGLSDNLNSWVAKQCASLCEDVHNDFIGKNTIVNSKEEILFVLDSRIDIFTDNLLDKISRCTFDRKDAAA